MMHHESRWLPLNLLRLWQTLRLGLPRPWQTLPFVLPSLWRILGMSSCQKPDCIEKQVFRVSRNSLFYMVWGGQGYVEIQDESSHLIGQQVDAKPGESVLDYCAGSGGVS